MLSGTARLLARNMSRPSFVLCSTPAQLKAAHQLRLDVFHNEQGFPADTEVDEYDPISAHFILIDPSSSAEAPSALGVLRLVPYPRPDGETLSAPSPSSSSPLGEVSSPSTLSEAFLDAASRKPAKGGAKLGRLAVRKTERGKKYGDDLVRLSEEWLRSNLSSSPAAAGDKDITICLSSQMHVQNFYKKHGFEPVGEPYIEEGAPHLWFSKTVRV